MKGVSGGIGLDKMLNKETLLEKESKVYQDRIEVLEDKIDISSNKNISAIKMQNLMKGLRTAIAGIAAPGGMSAFDDKKATVSATTDTGVGSDYIKVSASRIPQLGEFSVNVRQIAVAAKLTLQLGGGGGFDTAAPGLEGILTLNVGGHARNIAIDPAQSMSDIVKKINDTFSANSDDFKALIFDNGNGTSNIQIQANKTGLGNITHSYLDGHLFGGDVIDPAAAFSQVGTNAEITVNGIDLPSQTSNKFIDVPFLGVTIEALKANTAPVDKQTVKIEQDNVKALESLEKFRKAYNMLAAFVAQQSQKSSGLNYDKDFAGLDTGTGGYSEDAHLYNESILTEAKDLLSTVANTRPAGTGVNLKYSSISDIGLEIIKAPVSSEGMDFSSLDIKDPNLEVNFLRLKDDASVYKKAIEDNLDDVRSLFMNNGTVKSNPANNGATLSVTTVDKQLSSSVLGVDIPIALTFDGTGAITAMSATVGGIDVLAGLDAEGNKYYEVDADTRAITFSGTPLDGMRLIYRSNTAVDGVAENFTLNFTHGVADLALYQVNTMVNEYDDSGSIANAIEVIKEQLDKSQEEKSKVQEIMNTKKAEIENIFDTIINLELMASLQIDAINRILTPAA